MSFILISSSSVARPPVGSSMVRAALLSGALWAPSSACQSLDLPGDEEPGPAHREAWSDQDDPRLLDGSFEYVLDELPSAGVADRRPWPGSYWPTYLDSINHRWAGPNTRSPAEKYGLAFDKPGVEDAVSRHSGIDDLPGPACKTRSDCDKGELCARRRGEEQGKCSETWFGICHAWAPAAILEDEPRKPVTYNGVRFEINDLKALVSFSYTEGLSTRILSLRCDEKGSEHNISGIDACRDTNAGSFHVVVANLLGLRGTAFIEDRTYDYEVWNFPVIGYRVTRNVQVSPSTANKMLGAEGAHYVANDDAVELRRIRLELAWVFASPSELDGALTENIDWFTYVDVYNYLLELDEDGEIIGGEWLYGSRKNHPDFLWIPVKKYNATVAGIEYSDVKKLLELAGS